MCIYENRHARVRKNADWEVQKHRKSDAKRTTTTDHNNIQQQVRLVLWLFLWTVLLWWWERYRPCYGPYFLCWSSLLLSSSTRKRFHPQRPSGQAVVTGVFPSSPRCLPSLRSRIVGLSSTTFQLFVLVDLRRFSPTRALALSACRFVRKSPLWDSNRRPRPQWLRGLLMDHWGRRTMILVRVCRGKNALGTVTTP